MQFFVYIVLFLALSLILWTYNNQKYFKFHNIPCIKSIPLLGVFDDVILGKVGFYDQIKKICNQPEVKGKSFFGIFMCHKPALMIIDSELIKRILVKDFHDFSNRYLSTDVHDPLGYYNLFTVKNPLWRSLRGKFTPFFSSGQLKKMSHLIDKISANMVEKVHEDLDENHKIEMELKDLALLYTIDVIASCAFGIEANCLKNPEADFRKAAQKMFENTLKRAFDFAALFMIPQITKLFGVKFFSEFNSKFIFSVIPKDINERVKSKVKRNDLIDTIIKLKEVNSKEVNAKDFLTDDMLIAQAAVFFAAGKSKISNFNLDELNITVQFSIFYHEC
jgi:cytochrome P450 family 6